MDIIAAYREAGTYWPDIAAGLRRLKLSTIRQLTPELLITAKDPAVGAGGTAPHADRRRDHRTRGI
jgi:hypothetical protein